MCSSIIFFLYKFILLLVVLSIELAQVQKLYLLLIFMYFIHAFIKCIIFALCSFILLLEVFIIELAQVQKSYLLSVDFKGLMIFLWF